MSEILIILLARAGSKGLPGKNALPVCGKPMICWTLEHALKTKHDCDIVLSTDGDAIKAAAKSIQPDLRVIDRPSDLAGDMATVDAAARHCLAEAEAGREPYKHVVILYGNVPARPDDLIDLALDKLIQTGCDSVQSVSPVGKAHPYWMKKVEGDKLLAHIENTVFRRQDLPALYMLDGGIIVCSRESLLTVREGEPHAFLGQDRRAVITAKDAVVDVDGPMDYQIAQGVLSSQAPAAQVQIRGRQIDALSPAYVIAEIGVNHNGDVTEALALIDAAKKAGADAVKFQLFDAEMLLSEEAALAAYQKASADDPKQMLQDLQLTEAELMQCRGHARLMDIDFICTCFSMGLVDVMKRLQLDAVKIASPDMIHLPMLEALLELNLPILFSTGASDLDELYLALTKLLGKPHVMMHCVSSYPVPEGETSLNRMHALKLLSQSYGSVLGYSDHGDDVRLGGLAVAIGAKVIEKHFTLDRSAKGPDHAASFNPESFKEYVSGIRFAEKAMGASSLTPLDQFASAANVEADVRKFSRQSLCAARDLKAGEVLQAEDLCVKRPGSGIAPYRLTQVIGQKLKRDVKANHLLREDDIAS